MSIPSTKILDHIVHLTPPGTVEQTAQQFRDLGFNVIAGGTHTGGLTANALIILNDGAYLELIAFTHPPSHYPPGSPSRHERETTPWAQKQPGWIDFAFLGSSSHSIAHVINARAARTHAAVRYTPEVRGGRTTPDGRLTLVWVITAVEGSAENLRGVVPFFCGDVTPREWRVPVEPPSNTVHPSGVRGIAHIRLLVEPDACVDVAAQLTCVIGEPPQSDDAGLEYVWALDVPSGSSKPRVVLSAPTNEEERGHLATKGWGIFEVGFLVGPDGVEREANTPYGKIVWLKAA